MDSLVPRTALPGRSRSSHDSVAKGLGVLSLALGLAKLAIPRLLARGAAIDVPGALIRGYGAREVGSGIAILFSHDATPWIWARVGGDALDIGTIAAGTRSLKSPCTLGALAALAGASALDLYCAIGLTMEKGRRKTARADYRDRSGFPKGVERARGAARDFALAGT